MEIDPYDDDDFVQLVETSQKFIQQRQEDLERLGTEVTKEMENETYLYTFLALVDVIVGEDVNKNCIYVGDEICPGMVKSLSKKGCPT